MNQIEEYLNQDVFNPKYLFYGGLYDNKELESRQSIEDNEEEAFFLTSWFINAAAYAFKEALKGVNDNYSFSINNDFELPVMNFKVENLPDDLYGYVYVFEKNADMIKKKPKHTIQYKCYHDIEPIEVIKIYYKDFEKYFDKETIN